MSQSKTTQKLQELSASKMDEDQNHEPTLEENNPEKHNQPIKSLLEQNVFNITTLRFWW